MYLIPVEVKKSIQKVGLEYGLFSNIVKTKRILFAEPYKYPKNKNKPNFKLKGQQEI